MSISSVTISPTSYATSQLGVEDSLQSWCEKIPRNSPEHTERRKAADKIKECYHYRKDALDLSGNRLTSLPDAIGSLTALRELDLRGNHLTSLPAAIGSLTALQRLNLSGNQLTSLPDAIGSLTALQRLRPDGNHSLHLFLLQSAH